MPITQTTPLPAPPSRQDPANFSERADLFLAALVAYQTQQNAQASELNDLAELVDQDAQLVAQFQNKYLGAYAADPTTGLNGTPLSLGLLYFRTTAPQELRVYTSQGWKGSSSYVSGSIDVTGYVKASTYIKNQSTFKNPPTANLLLNNFGNFIIDTNTTSQINFSYNPSTPSAIDSLSFTVDLIYRPGADVLFPSSVRWEGGGSAPGWNKPVFNNNSRSILQFYTNDSGVSWLAKAVVLNASADNAPIVV